MPRLLLAGQIGDPTAALPGGAGAKLYVLNVDSYGQQVSSTGKADSLLRFESDDYPILGDGGRTLLRRIYVKIAYKGSCLLRVTPRVDVNTVLATQSWSLGPSLVRQVRVLDVKVARVCSFAGIRFDVVTRNQLVEIMGLACAHKPLSQAADFVAGTEAST
jgi:hypothetical protein